MTILLFLLLAFFALWFLKYLIELQLFKAKLKDFKCPPQTFLLGHLPTIAKDVMAAIKTYTQNYGKLLHINATFFAPVLFVSDHNIIKYILTSPSLINKGRIYELFDSFAAHSLALVTGEIWHKRRRLMNPIFSLQNAENALSIYNSAASTLVEILKKKQDRKIDIKPLLELCTLDATYELFLGTKLDSQINESNMVNVHTQELHRILWKKVLSPWAFVNFIYIFTPTYWRERAAVKGLSAETKCILTKHRTKAQEADAKNLTPFMNIMMGGPMDDNEIVNEINALIFESRDTVGIVIACALHLLGHYPKAQDRLAEEIKRTLNNDISIPISIEHLRELKYLESVIKETMRLYPPLSFIARRFDNDQNIDGILIPANVNVIMCIHTVQTSEEHFPEPDVFNPDRFYEGESKAVTPYTFLPFSCGPRNCIGQKLAMNQIKVILTHILRRFEVLASGEAKLNMILTPVIAPIKPILLRIRPREFK